MSEALWQDVECGAYTADLELWRELARAGAKRSGSCELLDIGCGGGRVSLELAGDDCAVTGLDRDPQLIAALQARSSERGLAVAAVVGDARSFSLRRGFDVVLAPMQLVQLIHDERERVAALSCVAAHLKSDGVAALALLEPEEHWEADQASAPIPDMLESGGWVYASQPVAVRRMGDAGGLELDRVRRAVSPAGELRESLSRVTLALVSPGRLEREARRAGLLPAGRRAIPATDEHMGSTVVLLSGTGAAGEHG